MPQDFIQFILTVTKKKIKDRYNIDTIVFIYSVVQ